MHYVDKLFSEIPTIFPKTIIIIPTAGDLAGIRSGKNYTQLNWYNRIVNIAKKYNAKFIDLAIVGGYNDSMFLTCDGYWSKKGNQRLLEVFAVHK